jgi:hypothetical protein
LIRLIRLINRPDPSDPSDPSDPAASLFLFCALCPSSAFCGYIVGIVPAAAC